MAKAMAKGSVRSANVEPRSRRQHTSAVLEGSWLGSSATNGMDTSRQRRPASVGLESRLLARPPAWPRRALCIRASGSRTAVSAAAWPTVFPWATPAVRVALESSWLSCNATRSIAPSSVGDSSTTAHTAATCHGDDGGGIEPSFELVINRTEMQETRDTCWSDTKWRWSTVHRRC